jgi:hypothetical protein
MHKIFFIFLCLAINLLIFQSNVYSQNKNQHREYNKIFLGSEIIKIDGFFYPKTKSHPNDRKLFLMDSGNSEEIMKEKNVKFISKNSKYLISNEQSRYDSHQHRNYEYQHSPPIDNDYKDPVYYCYRDKINNKIFCYCQNFSRKTLFHPNPEVSKHIENYGDIFKFEYIRENHYNQVQYCNIHSSNNYTCYFVKDLDGNYVKNKYPKDSEKSEKNEYILIACEEHSISREGLFVNNINKNCPISKTKNEDGNYYRDCTTN